MSSSTQINIRFPNELIKAIKNCDDRNNFSAWVKLSCQNNLFKKANLSEDILVQLSEMNKQMNGIGNNLNQLARKANSGDPVTIDNDMLWHVIEQLRETKKTNLQLVASLNGRLS